jgi:arylsulfatase A-like enzyme
MLGAAGGALSDSVLHYATAGMLSAIGLVLVVGALGAWRLTRRLPAHGLMSSSSRTGPLGIAAVLAALVIVALGPYATARANAGGLHRNAVTALILTTIPRVTARAGPGEWRVSPVGGNPAPGPFDDLRALAGAAAGRNVVLIVLESTGARYLRGYGAPDDPMPHLSAFSDHAIQFDRAYAVYPESIKGLFATLCSRSPAIDVSADAHAEAGCAPLPRVLGNLGYETALFHSGRFTYLGMDAIVRRQGFATTEDAGSIGGNRQSSFGVDEPSTVARMLAWLDGHQSSRPFFLAYLPVAGHHPYATDMPGPFTGADDLTAYKNALYDGDRSLGALFQGLRDRGLFDRTLWIVYGDHGEAFGQHDGNYGHSLFLYDENVHVPLLISMPGVTVERRRIGRVASLLDVAPTVLDLIGASVPAGYEGSSLLAPLERMALFQTDYSNAWLGLQDGCRKYLRELDAGRDRLYDTCQDPDERIDLSGTAGESARHVASYRDHTARWAAATRAAILSPPSRSPRPY